LHLLDTASSLANHPRTTLDRTAVSIELDRGGAINVAARVSALSAPSEILVSQTVRDLARTSSGVTFADRGEHDLKGVTDSVGVFAVAG